VVSGVVVLPVEEETTTAESSLSLGANFPIATTTATTSSQQHAASQQQHHGSSAESRKTTTTSSAGGPPVSSRGVSSNGQQQQQQLDFIGTSNVVKTLFSIPYNVDQPVCVAVHNLNGILFVDDASTADHHQEHQHQHQQHKTTTTRTASTTANQKPQQQSLYNEESKQQRQEEESSSSLAAISSSSGSPIDDYGSSTQSLELALSQTRITQNSDALAMLFHMIEQARAKEQKPPLLSNDNNNNNNNNNKSKRSTSNSNNKLLVDNGSGSDVTIISSSNSSSRLSEQTCSQEAAAPSPTTIPTTSTSVMSSPSNPREYLQWKFKDMNLIVGSDALIVRSPTTTAAAAGSSSDQTNTTATTALAVRVEDASDMRSLLQRHQEMVQRGQFVPDHQLAFHAQRGKLSYAQALLQQQQQERRRREEQAPANGNDDDDDDDETDQPLKSPSSFSAPNLDQVRLQTCIVPSNSGPLGGLLQGSSYIPPTQQSPIREDDIRSGPSSSSHQQSPLPSLSPVGIVLDAYLDNVMANVPQLALCLHEKGIVQSVKLLNTDEIPSSLLTPSTLDTSTPFSPKSSSSSSSAAAAAANREDIFSPHIMEMNASALLRFLKANCTRDNATYLLRREAGQANIQLYDISSISKQRQRQWNWWLATMSYRFALRLRHVAESSSSSSSNNNKNNIVLDNMTKRQFRDRQRSLYRTTLELLEELKDMDGRAHESLVAAVNEHMADTFLGEEDQQDTTTHGTTRTTAAAAVEETNDGASSPAPRPPVMTAATATTTTASAPSKEQQQQQPYATIPVDSLNKAQDHLVKGIKSLWPVLEEKLHDSQRARTQKSKKRNRQQPPRQQQQQQVAATEASSSSEDDEVVDDPLAGDASEAIIMQLFGLHYKLINVSLRLSEHHLRNYSSSAMQALRTSARRMADSGSLLQWLSDNNGNDSSSRLELFQSLQLQYSWMWENCGHFARAFASDDLWRDRGHACGDDVCSVLRDVEAAFAEKRSGSVGDDESELFPWYSFSTAKDQLYQRTNGMVSLQSLSAIVEPKTLKRRSEGAEESSLGPESVSAALAILGAQGQLQRDKRRVLVASCISYSRAILAFEVMVPNNGDDTASPRVHKARGGSSSVTVDQDVDQDPAILNLLRQRLGDACNETGKVLLLALRTLLSSPPGPKDDPKNAPLAAEALLSSAHFWFFQGLEAFLACGDLRNLALLRCNLCQCFKLRANSSFTSQHVPEGSSHAEECLQGAANHLQAAHETLGQRDVDPMTWDMVSEELAATFLVLGVRRRQSLLGGGNVPMVSHRLSPGKERSIADPMERALAIYEQSGNAHQAAAVHYQLALTNSKTWTCQRDEAKTREKLSAAFLHYNMAFAYFRSSLRGNEPTFVLLCLDLASLYAAVSGEECLTKALSRCLDTYDAFSREAIDAALASPKSNDWFDKMETLASSMEERVFKLLRSLVKLESENNAGTYKNLYRVGLTAKMVQNGEDKYENPEAARLSTLHTVLVAIKDKFSASE
jgi:hypothetical protein